MWDLVEIFANIRVPFSRTQFPKLVERIFEDEDHIN